MTNQEMISEGYKIRTIGLCQPYASAMLYGKIESRWVKAGHKPSFPLGLYMIYSTQRGYTASEIKAISGIYCSLLFHLLEPEHSLPDGAPIAIGQLYNVRRFDAGKDGILTFVDNHGLAETTKDLWCLEFINVERIHPFQFTGKQGVGILTEEQRKMIQIV